MVTVKNGLSTLMEKNIRLILWWVYFTAVRACLTRTISCPSHGHLVTRMERYLRHYIEKKDLFRILDTKNFWAFDEVYNPNVKKSQYLYLVLS